jgi:hypothetical protein
LFLRKLPLVVRTLVWRGFRFDFLAMAHLGFTGALPAPLLDYLDGIAELLEALSGLEEGEPSVDEIHDFRPLARAER